LLNIALALGIQIAGTITNRISAIAILDLHSLSTLCLIRKRPKAPPALTSPNGTAALPNIDAASQKKVKGAEFGTNRLRSCGIKQIGIEMITAMFGGADMAEVNRRSQTGYRRMFARDGTF